MAKGKSRNHHWWPVGLQNYWSDENGDVSWIDPDGNTDKKKSVNRKIGFKIHGHTLFRGHVWGESNFENEFDIDDKIHKIIANLKSLKPRGEHISPLISWWKSIRKNDLVLNDTCAKHHIKEQDSRDLLLFLYSLLIRSPSYRSKYEKFPAQFGLPVSENVGKANMRQSYLLAKKLCQEGVMTNRFFVILHSDHSRFICGDGYLDWLSGSLQARRVNGRALIPLTPHLCVYICTPMAMRTDRNCAAIRAAPWMVERVNEITQVYSRDRLFFLGRKPQLSENFLKREFLEHSNYKVDLLDKLDEIAQPNTHWG
ncbi:MAG: hypothetical protein OSB73_20690, partial [Candidatus Latescibacteria bacterium]|nr:hypothetical protein [Candidatus Latescibacterota bacterium]